MQLYKAHASQLSYNNYFSFYLTDNASGSHLFLGGVDYSKIAGSLYSFPVTNQAYWQIGKTQAYVNGKATAASNLQSVIDTGTTLFYAVSSASRTGASQSTQAKYADGLHHRAPHTMLLTANGSPTPPSPKFLLA